MAADGRAGRIPGRMSVLAGLAAAWCGSAQAAPCTPGELMAKVATLTGLLERKIVAPMAERRAAAARMQAAIQRRQQGVTDYDGVCVAYDDLIGQLRR